MSKRKAIIIVLAAAAIAIALALIMLITSCSNFNFTNLRSANGYAKEVLQCLDDGDEDALYDLFSEFTKNTETELKEQIHNAVVFFKGDITEIDVISVGGSDAIDYGKIIYKRPSIVRLGYYDKLKYLLVISCKPLYNRVLSISSFCIIE
jgi:spermidine/putrescine-binding protein